MCRYQAVSNRGIEPKCPNYAGDLAREGHIPATHLPVAGEDQGKLTGEQEKYFRILRTRFFLD